MQRDALLRMLDSIWSNVDFRAIKLSTQAAMKLDAQEVNTPRQEFNRWLTDVGIHQQCKKPELTVKRLLNRLLGMQIDRQNLVFEHFMTVLDHQIKLAKEDGTWSQAVTDISGESIELKSVRPLPRHQAVSGYVPGLGQKLRGAKSHRGIRTEHQHNAWKKKQQEANGEQADVDEKGQLTSCHFR